MKKFCLSRITLISIILVSVFMLIGCEKQSKEDWSEEINLLVSYQFVDYYPFGVETPLRGISTREEKSNIWVSLHENGIEGFSYEEGYEYNLKVLKTHLGNPPMDASSFRYKLVTIISRIRK